MIAHVKLSKLEELASHSFRGPESDIIHGLNSEKAGAVLGVESKNGYYTIIGESGLIVRNSDGCRKVISFDQALSYLQENGMKVGKGGDFEFVDFGPNGLVWMKDVPTMCAIWNIVISMQRRQK